MEEKTKPNTEAGGSTTAPGIEPDAPGAVPVEPKAKDVSKEPSQEETVPVSKKFLEEIQKTLKEQQKDIGLLKSVADKKALALYHQRHKKDIPSIIKIRVMDVEVVDAENPKIKKIEEKVVMGWGKMKQDDVFDMGNNRWREIQIVNLVYQDGTSSGDMKLVDFNRRFRHIECQKIGVITNEETGELFYKLARKDTGEELTIGATFVN